jgi:hypothetical protein
VNFCVGPAGNSFSASQSNRGHFSEEKFTSLPESKRQIAWLQMEQVVAGSKRIRLFREQWSRPFSFLFSFSLRLFSVDATSHFSLFTSPSGQPRLDSFYQSPGHLPYWGQCYIYIEFANNTQKEHASSNQFFPSVCFQVRGKK